MVRETLEGIEKGEMEIRKVFSTAARIKQQSSIMWYAA